MRYFVLFGLIAFVIISCFYLVGSLLDRRRQKLAVRDALEHAIKKRDQIWKEADSVADIVSLYVSMVVKHGPDSEEAKAFRFGTTSKLMKELHKDSEARCAFEQQADIIDDIARRMRA